MRFSKFLKEALEGEKENAFPDLILGRHNDTLEEVRRTNPKELAAGIKVEMEHVPDGTEPKLAREIANRIALDHIAECKSSYYARLKKMESECEGEE